jgi:hypothetical protein
VGFGGASGMVTYDSETFRLDSWVYEVAGEATGAPELGDN